MLFSSTSKNKIRSVYKIIKNLNKEKIFLVEDLKTYDMAIVNNLEPVQIFLTKEFFKKNKNNIKITDNIKNTVNLISEKELNKLKTLKNNPGIISIFKFKKFPEIKNRNKYVCIILDKIQNPGNVGTIIRSALNFGISEIYTTEGTASIHNPKVIRGSMGAIFDFPVNQNIDIEKKLIKQKTKGFTIFFTSSKQGIHPKKIKLNTPSSIVFGNESKGISKKLKQYADHWINIPNTDKIDSLGVATSSSIIMYEIYNKIKEKQKGSNETI